MKIEQILDEYQKNGRISGKAMNALKQMLRQSHDPFTSITTAGDVGAFQLSEEIARHLDSEDSMVRWNAAGVLFTRFRDIRFAARCIDLLDSDNDTMVRSIALLGAGEMLPMIEDPIFRGQLAKRLLSILETDELQEMQSSAYLGIEAALGIPPLERSPATRLLDPEKDFKKETIEGFRAKYEV